MVIRKALTLGANIIKNSGISSFRRDASVLLAKVLKCDDVYMTVHCNDELKKEDELKFFNLVNARANHTPVAYLTGTKEFMGLDFSVTKDVLIPRPDTEALCELVIEKAPKDASVLDLCCGSGCVGLSISHYVNAGRTVLCDISEKALAVSRINAEKLGIDAEFLQRNVLLPYDFGLFDVIASNPPYIKSDVISTLSEDVKGYEPHIALDGGASGLDFYSFMCPYYKKHLKDGGIIAFEVGFDQAEQVCALLEKSYGNYDVKKDLSGISRVCYAIK